MKAGLKDIPPVVLVDGGADKLTLADGYHRTLAAEHAGIEELPAYVGTPGSGAGDWKAEVLQMQAKIRSQAKDEMSKSQREYFLREQMRAIKNELGDGDAKSEELEELREKVKSRNMPAPVETEALKQLGRLERHVHGVHRGRMAEAVCDQESPVPIVL